MRSFLRNLISLKNLSQIGLILLSLIVISSCSTKVEQIHTVLVFKPEDRYLQIRDVEVPKLKINSDLVKYIQELKLCISHHNNDKIILQQYVKSLDEQKKEMESK